MPPAAAIGDARANASAAIGAARAARAAKLTAQVCALLGASASVGPTTAYAAGVRLPGHLVDARWLRANLGRRGLVVADVRWHPGGDARAAYEAAHVPGAVFLDADRQLAGRPFVDGPGRHPLPTPESFAETMAAAGVGDADAVVAYDDAGGSHAARLWWMLRVTGHDCALLDGGLAAWDGDVHVGWEHRPRAVFSPRPWPRDRIVEAGRVAQALRDGSPAVLDARAPERYRGEVEPIDPVAGHIPGARSAPWAENLDPATGRLRAPEELRRRYRSLGVRGEDAPIAYCGSGLTATLDLLALEVAGLGPGRLYVGSWSGWVAERRPVATGG
jgi:thiosulfate/3-mercaptopyruvate sulfurtransferase